MRRMTVRLRDRCSGRVRCASEGRACCTRGQVSLDRLGAQEARRSHLSVRCAGRHLERDLQLVRGELLRSSSVALPRRHTGRSQLGACALGPRLSAQPLERLQRRAQPLRGSARRLARRTSTIRTCQLARTAPPAVGDLARAPARPRARPAGRATPLAARTGRGRGGAGARPRHG